MLSKLRDREAALQIREARVAEKEESVKHLEREGKNQVLRDAQELRQQLTGARAELDSERQYVEDKRRIAEAIAATIEEREAKLRVREEEVEKMELSLQERERKLNSYASEQRDILKCYPLDSQARTIDFLKMHEEQERRDIRTNGKHENTVSIVSYVFLCKHSCNVILNEVKLLTWDVSFDIAQEYFLIKHLSTAAMHLCSSSRIPCFD